MKMRFDPVAVKVVSKNRLLKMDKIMDQTDRITEASPARRPSRPIAILWLTLVWLNVHLAVKVSYLQFACSLLTAAIVLVLAVAAIFAALGSRQGPTLLQLLLWSLLAATVPLSYAKPLCAALLVARADPEKIILDSKALVSAVQWSTLRAEWRTFDPADPRVPPSLAALEPLSIEATRDSLFIRKAGDTTVSEGFIITLNASPQPEKIRWNLLRHEQRRDNGGNIDSSYSITPNIIWHGHYE